jgi:hypothetical protein
MSHKEVTSEMRAALKVAGIKARVRLYVSCGVRYVEVFVPAYEIEFTEAEQATIKAHAARFGFTGSRGSALREDPTNPKTFHFEYHG